MRPEDERWANSASTADGAEAAWEAHHVDEHELELIDAWWRAANYLTVGQIYLQGNPLLQEPLAPEHIKPRLLGHWGTSPGLNLVYAHLNRLIRRDDLDVLFVAGPGHGGPAIVANVYLEGSYTEIYPVVGPDALGMQRLFRQFSTPGGIPSHVSVPTPGSIHEGGELGYALAHAFGAAFDNPGLVVAAVVGDGEAETGPLEGSWKSIRFLNPARDGAVLPILAARPCSAGYPPTTSRRCCGGTGIACAPCAGTNLPRCTRPWPRCSTSASTRSAPSKRRPGRRGIRAPRWMCLGR
jgi:xylulose-5-phosphate/fructose-6-phosphate phosphoketolase